MKMLMKAKNEMIDGNYEQALKAIGECLRERNKKFADHKIGLAVAYKVLGEIKMQIKRFYSAIDNFEEALKNVPDNQKILKAKITINL